MTTHLSLFEEFMLRFSTLKNAAKGDPSRVSVFHKESQAISEAVNAMESFLLRTDFERRVFHGSVKHFPQVPPTFELVWNEYSQNWADLVSKTWLSLNEFELSEKTLTGEELIAFKKMEATAEDYVKSSKTFEKHMTEHLVNKKGIRLKPDERFIFSLLFGRLSYAITNQPNDYHLYDGIMFEDKEFDPRKHDGAYLLQALISYLRDIIERNEEFTNEIRVSLGAHDYLTETIGLNLEDIFRRWQSVPITFMPAHVSNKYGATEKGSLNDLINDAVRAYVCGAPAAAITTCRAALEEVLRRHYGKGEWDDSRKLKLGVIIVLASQKFDFIQEKRLGKLVKSANEILHNYSNRNRMSKEDELTILEFLKTVKFLIQRAPN